jgi:hypothetical protein
MGIDEAGADGSHTDHPCHGGGKADSSRDDHHSATAAVQLGKEVTKMTDRRADKAPGVRDERGRKDSHARDKDSRSRDKRSDADRRRR